MLAFCKSNVVFYLLIYFCSTYNYDSASSEKFSSHIKIEWLKEMFHNSDFHSDVTVYPYDHNVTFSTCEYSFQNARYVVHGRLVEITEGVNE